MNEALIDKWENSARWKKVCRDGFVGLPARGSLEAVRSERGKLHRARYAHQGTRRDVGMLRKHHRNIVFLLLSAAALVGCAKRSSEIAPDFLHAGVVIGGTCQQLVAQRDRCAERLAFARLTQDQISRDDNLRTFGVPTLFGTIFEGDDEPEVASLKASLIMLDQELIRARCTYPAARPL